MKSLSLNQSYVALAVIAALIALVGTGDYEDALVAAEHYCEMVESWDVSGGERGHPDYDNRNC